ncbi:hypothetical protein ACFTQ7_18370 [Lysinibacillus sp. NPDC056959]
MDDKEEKIRVVVEDYLMHEINLTNKSRNTISRLNISTQQIPKSEWY